MNVNDAFPSKFLKADDLGRHEPIVEIEDVYALSVHGHGSKVSKLVVTFVGKAKGLVLNKTNATTIAEILGSPETETWRGRAIRLYATTTKFGNETVSCVRVKAAGPVAARRHA